MFQRENHTQVWVPCIGVASEEQYISHTHTYIHVHTGTQTLQQGVRITLRKEHLISLSASLSHLKKLQVLQPLCPKKQKVQTGCAEQNTKAELSYLLDDIIEGLKQTWNHQFLDFLFGGNKFLLFDSPVACLL